MATDSGFSIDIDFSQDVDAGSRQRPLDGGLVLKIGRWLPWNEQDERGQPVPDQDCWRSLLEWMSDAWLYLRHDTTEPLRLLGKPLSNNPALWWDEALDRWDSPDYDSDRASKEESDLVDWLNNHDISCGLPEKCGARVVFLRVGAQCMVSCPDGSVTLGLEEALTELTRCGDTLAERLRGSTLPADQALVARWKSRDNTSVEGRLAAFGANVQVLRALRSSEALATWSLELDAVDPNANPLLLAARACQDELPTDILSKLLAQIREIRERPTPVVDELARKVTASLRRSSRTKPFRQGYMAAATLRSRLGAATGAIDPVELLDRWNVAVQHLQLGTEVIDAVACWGGGYGPVILVNDDGRHAQGTNGLRATLAHEIGHLMVDRWDCVPVCDVSGLRSRLPHEQRANAFAAELLVPQDEIKRRLIPGCQVTAVVTDLAAEYGASRQLVAWHATNSATELDSRAKGALRDLCDEDDTWS
ncbi:MAG: ImmA/IrrE family metallo-endopeptidase [Fimbriimonadaceae bacterium]|nr:ImmA/IrrE family metallo-endopeptidase [Fimbriimonadaceae bacterium]